MTSANVLTVARAIGTSVILLIAAVKLSQPLLLAGLIASWGLDIADGQLARSRKEESVLGAQLDILADRATAVWVVLGVVVINQASPLAVFAGAAVCIQLCFFDQLLANQFLRFGHWSPDEFHLEDPRVWYLNWAPASKVFGNLPLALLALGGGFLWAAIPLALALASIRVASYLQIEQRTGFDGHYDPRTNEAFFRVHGCAAPSRFPLDRVAEQLVDEEGRIVAIRVRDANTHLPVSLLELLPPTVSLNDIVAPPPERNDVSLEQISTQTPDGEPAPPLEAAA